MTSAPQVPAVIINPPGQDAIAYRVADFAGFRAALLASLPGEQELTSFAPAAGRPRPAGPGVVGLPG